MRRLKPIIGILVLTGLLYISPRAEAQKQTKDINKVFQISKGDILNVENKFGDIDVLTWEKSEISISVKLTATGKSEAVSQNMLEKISVDINKSGNTVKATTGINNEQGMGRGNSFSIDYTIYAPEWVNLTLSNKFGNINLEKCSALLNLELKYGNLRVSALSGGDAGNQNRLEMGFSEGVIENAGSLKLELAFSKLEIGKADNIVAETKYSVINTNSLNSFKIESKYDNFKFDELKNLEGELRYSNLHIGQFLGKLKIESTYSGVKINEVMPSFESMDINNSKGGYKIGINSQTQFELSVKSLRGDVDADDFNVIQKKNEGNLKLIIANNGAEGKGKLISIVSEDGSVKVTKK